ncbi:hypothetical protein EDB83DRAFT_2448458 [Lactarius deliciosus]|nr:hypothetical protein EDB83DRAFT_2448458 [Lactarius deliciosus]
MSLAFIPLPLSFPLQLLCLHDFIDVNAAPSAFGPATLSSCHCLVSGTHTRGSLTVNGQDSTLFEEMSRAGCEHLRELGCFVECLADCEHSSDLQLVPRGGYP